MKPVQYEVVYRTERDHWWYRVRRELAKKLIAICAGKGGGLHILDIGCGTGALMTELASLGEVEGVDASEIAIEYCRSRGLTRVRVGSAEALPYPEGTFDIVLALDVLEHVRDDRVAIAEIRRVLKQGGAAVIFVPAFRFLWGAIDELGEHFRRYTLRELRAKLAESGFGVRYSSYFNFFLFLPILFVRKLVRLFRTPSISENEIGSPIINALCYRVFSFERALLPHVRFPFGVSVMAVCRKQQ